MKLSYQSDPSEKANHRRIAAINGLLVFNFFNNEFCIDLEDLTEIANVNEVRIDVNSSSEAILSFENHEYKFIQFHKIMGYPQIIKSDKNRIIIVDIYGKKIAFIAEMINEILTTEFLLVSNNLSMEFIPLKKYIKGAIKFQDRNIFVPDFAKICKELNQLAIMSGISIRANKHQDHYGYNRFMDQ